MELATVATVLAWLTVLAGLSLAVAHVRNRRPYAWLAWAHPLAAVATLACLWTAVARWPGPVDMRFNAGAFVVSVAFVAGAFMFSLRVTRLPVPLLAIIVHAIVALIGCALVLAGLLYPLG